MPIYEFQCQACGHRFDRLQKMSDPDPTECPSCAANAVTRQLSAPQFRLSGGGWYETDFKKEGDKKRNLAGEGGGEKSVAAASSADGGVSTGSTPAPSSSSGSESKTSAATTTAVPNASTPSPS